MSAPDGGAPGRGAGGTGSGRRPATPRVEELAWERTPLGEISLRRRREPVTGREIHEVKLGDEFLMSSLFTEAEVELARLGLAVLRDDRPLDVVVGGLGLGYTAAAVLDDVRVRELVVVDAIAEVIAWHRDHLVPLGARLTEDPRCRLVHGDFFALVAGDGALDGSAGSAGSDEGAGVRRFDAVLVDIDHSPEHVLNPANASFYTPEGLRHLRRHLRPGGVFGLWSNDPPHEGFLVVLRTVLPDAVAHVVRFDNPLQRRTSTNTVYVGTLPA